MSPLGLHADTLKTTCGSFNWCLCVFAICSHVSLSLKYLFLPLFDRITLEPQVSFVKNILI